MRAGGDAGVVDHRVQPAQAVHVAGETARLLEVGEVPDDGRSAPVQEVADGREPVAVASVDDDLAPVVEQRLRGRSSEPSAEPVMKTRAISAEARERPGVAMQASSDTACWSASTPLGRGRGAMLVDVDIAEFGGRTAVPLIVICQCAVVRRVVAP